jgi:hypothetical protein
MATPYRELFKTAGTTPQTDHAMQKHKAADVGKWQLTDRNGELTDVWLPHGVYPPVGWYPGDPDVQEPEKKPLPKETPPKTVLPADYDIETHCTPAGADINAWRAAWPRPGVPGETEENSFNLTTPCRA